MHSGSRFAIKNTFWVSMQPFYITQSHCYDLFAFFLKNIVCHFAHRWDIKFHLYEFLCSNLAFIDFGDRCILTIFRDDWIFWLHMLLQSQFTLVLVCNHFSISGASWPRKTPKVFLLSNLESTHSQLSLEKNNAVGIFDRYATYFETKLIWASRRLVVS